MNKRWFRGVYKCVLKNSIFLNEYEKYLDCTSLGIASQGKTTEEAMKNIKEAITLYLEEQPENSDEVGFEESPMFSVIEVNR